mgnify:CR=1 FL=1
MQLNELYRLHPLSNSSGRPEHNLTDKQWQEEFHLRRLYITPCKKQKKMGGRYSQDIRKWNTEAEEYKGVTNWQRYCSFINDVLSEIRSGKIEYVFFKYQILDLLKFHYNSLKTKYIEGEGYWEVWLE